MANDPTGRRLRISNTRKPGSVYTRYIDVHDAVTGEVVSGVTSIILTLSINRAINEAEVTYYELGDNGGVVPDENGNPIEHTTKVQNVEVDDITAFEIMDNIRKENNPWQ